MTYRRSHIDRDGTRLAVWHGGTGAPVVMQHGLLGDYTQPAEMFPHGRGFSHLVMEARGHGASQIGPHAALSIAGFCDDLAAIIEQAQIGPCPVGGISMGAALALRLAVTRPDLVTALILARPAWAFDAAPANMAPNAAVGRLLATRSPEAARQAFETSGTGMTLKRDAPDNYASLIGFFDRAPQDETAALLARISADGPGVSAEQAARVACPTLVIGTAQDVIHPLPLAECLAGVIPEARLVRITPKGEDRTAHTQAFRDALSDFLTALPNPA